MMAGFGSLSVTAEKDAGPVRTLGLWLTVIAVAAGGGLRAAGAVLNRGIYWPDEIYETLEPAHWLVFGYGLRPWEYIQGAHSWALPGAIASVPCPP
jgi:phosphatidylinositol glycan class B